jgi:hypothetical protein
MSVKNSPYTANSIRVVISNEVTYTNILTQMNTAITGLGWTLWDSVDNWIPGSPILFTATISGTAMTVSAVSSGALAVGQTVTGSGVTSNSVITVAPASQLTGSYTLSQSSTVGSATAMSVVSSNASPMFLRVYRALNADAVTYKYFIIWYDIRKQAFWTGTCESWDATNHVATNLAWNNNGSFVQNYDIKDSFIWVSATARHIVIWPFILGEPGLWTGVFEFERIAPEDTVTNAAPCWAWTNSVMIGTQFADGGVAQHVSPSKTMFAFPRTQDGLTGAAAAATYAPVTNRGSFPPSYPSGTVTHGGASFWGYIGGNANESTPNATLTVGGMNTGTIVNGILIRGPGVVPGTRIVSFGTGTGGTGTYNVNIAQQTGNFQSSATTAVTAPMNSGADPHLLHLASAYNMQYGWPGAKSDTGFRSNDRSFVSPISVDAIGKNMPFGRMYNVSVTKPIGSALEITQTTLDSSGGWASSTGTSGDAVILPMNGGSAFPPFFSAYSSTYQSQINRTHHIRIATPSTFFRSFLLGDYIYASCYSASANGGIWRISVSQALTSTALNALFTPQSLISAISPTWTQVYQNNNGLTDMIFDGERSIYAVASSGQTVIKMDTETLSASSLTITNGSQLIETFSIDNKYLYVVGRQNASANQVAVVDLSTFTQASTFTTANLNGLGMALTCVMPNYSGHAYAVQIFYQSAGGPSYAYTFASSTGTGIPLTTNSNLTYASMSIFNIGSNYGFNAGCHAFYMDPTSAVLYYLKTEGANSVTNTGMTINRCSPAVNPTAISITSFVTPPAYSYGQSIPTTPGTGTTIPVMWFQGFIKGRMYFKSGSPGFNVYSRAILSDPNNASPGDITIGASMLHSYTNAVNMSNFWLDSYYAQNMMTNGPRMCVTGPGVSQIHLVKNIYSMHSTEGDVASRLLVKA